MGKKAKLTKALKSSDTLDNKDAAFTSAIEKARRDTSLPNLFAVFDTLEPLPKKKKSTSKRKRSPIEIEFISHVESIIKLIMTIHRNSGLTSWPKIIYEYMKSTTENDSFIDFLGKEQKEHTCSILRSYVSIVPTDDLLMQTMIELASSLLHFIEEHKIDSYSCLVGLVASKDVIETTKSEEPSDIPTKTDDCRATRSDLLHQIMNWAMIDDPEQLQREVREFTGQLRGVKNLQCGVLVLVEIKKEKFVYARYRGDCEGTTAKVCIDPHEEIYVPVRLDTVYPLKPSTIQRIQERTVYELEKLVQLPTDILFQNFMRIVEKRTHDYFMDVINIDMNVIRKANNNLCSISELQYLKDAQKKLRSLCEDPPSTLFTDLELLLKEKISELQKQENLSGTFIPTKKKHLRQLQDFQISQLVMMHVHRYVGICESGLDQLKLQKRELMSGERKDKITAWWLHEIDKEVLGFLETKGYVYDAVPENYVEQPPDDLIVVRENVRILSNILNNDDTTTGIKDVIQILQDRIYPKIEEFVTDAKIVLSEQFGMDLTGKDFSLPQVEAAFEKERDNINDSQVCEWIDDMIKDIHYLNEMHKLEDPEYAKENQVSLHIVPISGLVVGMVCRLENECKTVCELWEPVDYQDAKDRTMLHEAVTDANLDQISEILQNSPDDINIQDENGFTPLHCAASNYTIGHLRILDKIIGISNVDVNLRTFQGNTALYYLVRYPTDNSEETQELLLQVIQKLIHHNANVNAKNNSGETCLHSACVLDTPSVVKLLLASSASATEKNFEGESCCFTAVKGGNIRVVKALLDYGISSEQEGNGKTLLDVARQLNNTDMIRLLSGEAVEVIWNKPKTKYKKIQFKEEIDKSKKVPSMQFSMDDIAHLLDEGDDKKIEPKRAKLSMARSQRNMDAHLSPDGSWGTRRTIGKQRTQISLGSTRNESPTPRRSNTLVD